MRRAALPVLLLLGALILGALNEALHWRDIRSQDAYFDTDAPRVDHATAQP